MAKKTTRPAVQYPAKPRAKRSESTFTLVNVDELLKEAALKFQKDTGYIADRVFPPSAEPERPPPPTPSMVRSALALASRTIPYMNRIQLMALGDLIAMELEDRRKRDDGMVVLASLPEPEVRIPGARKVKVG